MHMMIMALRCFLLIVISTSAILQHLKLVAKLNSSDEAILTLKIVLWRINLVHKASLDRFIDCTIFCKDGSEHIQIFLDLLSIFRTDSQLISIIFQILMASIKPTSRDHAQMLVKSGIETCVVDIIATVDDYYVGLWGRRLKSILEQARMMIALENLRVLALAFECQTSSSVIEKVMVQQQISRQSHFPATIKDCTSLNHESYSSPHIIISKDLDILFKIVEDCDDQEVVVNEAMKLLLAYSDVILQYINHVHPMVLLLTLLSRYPNMWRLNAVLIKLGKQFSTIEPLPDAKNFCEGIVAVMQGGLSSKLQQICLWTLSSFCRDYEFRQAFISKLDRDGISAWFKDPRDDTNMAFVVPPDFEFLWTTSLSEIGLREEQLMRSQTISAE